MARHVFLTGPPGVGKTTLIHKASEVLKSSGVPVDGFYTEEVRQGGRRIGFDVVTLSGTRGPLSRVGLEPPPGKRECRVGQYVVDLTSFEQLALPVLRNVSHQGKQKPPSARYRDMGAEQQEVKTRAFLPPMKECPVQEEPDGAMPVEAVCLWGYGTLWAFLEKTQQLFSIQCLKDQISLSAGLSVQD
ncbi:cancer-related nucleoside-triphosphatase isoform X2 [Gorilla gorilla gorilla]|uniref:cancer-related nucleoside-triphosphatase isoform X2 n=1 Tax=Gorilla gorilla gorilla TaxID=9595 RepID=UPI0024458176|nr:cancer-related nucleoside-triphosphatase isoform X2 [Gorilla gorilla gorilla]